MNPFKGSPLCLFAVLIPIMLPQVLPEPLLWIWLTLAVLWVLKRLGVVRIGLGAESQYYAIDSQACLTYSDR